MSAMNDLSIAETENGFRSFPSSIPQDALDLMIGKWMDITGDNGSDARLKIARLAEREIEYMSQQPNLSNKRKTCCGL